jgi:hypothetical protein
MEMARIVCAEAGRLPASQLPLQEPSFKTRNSCEGGPLVRNDLSALAR